MSVDWLARIGLKESESGHERMTKMGVLEVHPKVRECKHRKRVMRLRRSA